MIECWRNRTRIIALRRYVPNSRVLELFVQFTAYFFENRYLRIKIGSFIFLVPFFLISYRRKNWCNSQKWLDWMFNVKNILSFNENEKFYHFRLREKHFWNAWNHSQLDLISRIKLELFYFYIWEGILVYGKFKESNPPN